MSRQKGSYNKPSALEARRFAIRVSKPAFAFLSTVFLSACVTTQVDQFITEAPIIAGDEAVVVITNRQDAIVEAEKSFIDCLNGRLSSLRKRVNIITESRFKDEMFPWFESRLAPTDPESVKIMLEQPEISQKATNLGVRYLVWIHGESAATNKQGSLSCSFSPAGGGCFGMLSWDNNSTYEASIWDLEESRSLGVISSEATGTSVMPALIVPIPIIARTKTASCRGLGDQLRSVLEGDA